MIYDIDVLILHNITIHAWFSQRQWDNSVQYSDQNE